MKKLTGLKRMAWIALLVAGGRVCAQQVYRTSVGLRFGWTSGICVKQNIGGQNYLDALLGFRAGDASFTLLAERYKSLKPAGFALYYGGGMHLASAGRGYLDKSSEREFNYLYGNKLGIDGILGVEYRFPTTPLILAIDMKPYTERNRTGIWMTAMDPGLTLRIVF